MSAAWWLVAGVAGVALLAGGCWWASTRARRKDDAAPRVSLPSLHELQSRRDRR